MKTPQEIIDWAVKDYCVYGERSNAFFRLSTEEHNAVDAYFYHTLNHPLCYQPGTKEYRFTTIIKELAAKMKTLAELEAILNALEQPIMCEQCGKIFEHGNTNASARFDFCSQSCEDVYRSLHSSHYPLDTIPLL